MHSDSAAPAATSVPSQVHWLSRLAGRLRHPILQNDGNASIDRLVRIGHQELDASHRCFDEGHRNHGAMHAQSASQLLRRAVDRAAIAEVPLDAEVYIELAEACALLGQDPQAARTEDPAYWAELARRAIAEERWGEARSALLQLHQRPNHAAEALEGLDHVCREDGLWEAALDSDDDPGLWHPLGECALAAGHAEAAMALWDAAGRAGFMQSVADSAMEVLHTHPDALVRRQAAGLVLALGPSVHFCCATAIEALSLDLTLARRLVQRAEALAEEASLAARSDGADGGAHASDADNELALEQTSRAMLQALLRRGHYDADAVGLMKALRTDDAALLFELGVAVGDAGLHADAYGLLRRAANLAPPTAAGYALLADAARAAGQAGDAPRWSSLCLQASHLPI